MSAGAGLSFEQRLRVSAAVGSSVTISAEQAAALLTDVKANRVAVEQTIEARNAWIRETRRAERTNAAFEVSLAALRMAGAHRSRRLADLALNMTTACTAAAAFPLVAAALRCSRSHS